MARGKSKLEPVYGAKVRLLRDIKTRGGITFREGLTMWLMGTYGRWHLTVVVRGIYHSVTLLKKDYLRYFEVLSTPNQEDE